MRFVIFIRRGVDGGKNQYFYSLSRSQRFESAVPVDDAFVAVTFTLPLNVAPRPKLPTGLIETQEQYELIFHPNDEKILNPDQLFQG